MHYPCQNNPIIDKNNLQL